MNRPEKGFRTKEKLAEALKTLLRKKPLNRIRIHEITDLCELNRQTFYYHFSDVYALFFWTLRQTVEQLWPDMAAGLPWREQLLALLRRIEADRSLFLEALDPRFELEFRQLFARQLAQREDFPLSSTQVTVFLSVLLNWLLQENRASPEEFLTFLEQLLQDPSPKVEEMDLLF